MIQNAQPPELQEPYDIFIIGGGINGAGIARDAAGRGLSVYLCEKNDLAQGTSSASTKMIHGGLRYLEFYEFRLVREALQEREVLLNSAPNIIWPMEFILPHSPSLRSIWLVRLGLFLYDHLAKRKRMGRSYAINLRESRFGKPLKRYVTDGFVYSDCWVEDSRLVILTALDAAKRGAQIHNYTTFLRAERIDHLWRIFVRYQDGREDILYSRYLINAAGPGVQKVAEKITGGSENLQPLRLVKGSHIVLPRLYDGEHAYLLQHSDRRMVFVIPFEDQYTLVGTTDLPADENDLDGPKISDAEIDYLLEVVNMYFTNQVTRSDIQYTYSGIRPLFDDGSKENSRVTRDYVITLEHHCLSIYGGKITTFRRLAEEAIDRILDDARNPRPHWTGKAVLPGGDIGDSIASFTQSVMQAYPFLPEAMATRLASQYGTRIHDLLRGIRSLSEMGTHFGADLYSREVDFMIQYEWVRNPDDVLFRRSRIGMKAPPEVKEKLAAYMAEKIK